MDRPIIEHQLDEFPYTTTQNQQELPASMQDQAPTEFKCQQKMCETFIHQDLTFLQPSEIYTSPIESQDESTPPDVARDQQPVTENPIQPVEPVLGTTSIETFNPGFPVFFHLPKLTWETPPLLKCYPKG